MTRNTATGLAFLALCACGDEVAILEVRLVMPAVAAGDARDQAFVQARRSESFPFELDEQPGWWATDQDDGTVALGPEPSEARLSVVTDEAGGDLNLRVSFCTQADCTDVVEDTEPPQEWFWVIHPFYPGQRTFWDATIPSVPAGTPAEPVKVEPCEVRGCTEGEATTYCDIDGQHFCESE